MRSSFIVVFASLEPWRPTEATVEVHLEDMLAMTALRQPLISDKILDIAVSASFSSSLVNHRRCVCVYTVTVDFS